MNIYEMVRVKQFVSTEELQRKYVRVLDSYKLVAAFAEDAEVAEIAHMKLEQLMAAGREAGLSEEIPQGQPESTEQTEIAAIKLALNSSRADASALRGANIAGRIDVLPLSAEKHYLKTIVGLKLDSGIEGCRRAYEEIHKALRLDGDNAAYQGLKDAIQYEIVTYENRLQQTQNAVVMQAEQERRRRETLDAARRKRMIGTAAVCVGCPFAVGLCYNWGYLLCR